MQNLNEECLLAYLYTNPGSGASPLSQENTFLSELQRIFRHKQYVSFPPAILVRHALKTEKAYSSFPELSYIAKTEELSNTTTSKKSNHPES